MSDIAIHVEGLSKRYQLGHRESYVALRDVLMNTIRAPFRHRETAASEIFWALKDVSFDVRQGEVIGVIGRNGAGKSTLLKILSRITKPTEGFIRIRGRVGSLLEVGTGFHPELTGRENIFLNGAILGMKRHEIIRKFDEIVAFAEIEQFIDTPVKRYSSGMYMRLAFAVAAHLEPEILLVDEVLAVGDAAFQKKCLGKMGDVAKEGRTVLFVSHNMAAVENLCHSAVVMSHGKIQFLGAVNMAIKYNLDASDTHVGITVLTDGVNRFGSGEMRLISFWVENDAGCTVSSVTTGSQCILAVAYISTDGRSRRDVSMSILISTIFGAPVSLINTDILNQHFAKAPPRGVIRFKIPKLPLTAGRYVVDLNLATHAGHTYADFIKTAAAFDVDDGDFYGTGRPGNPGAPVLFDGQWSLEVNNDSQQPNGYVAGV